jgi:hypothetical protein
MSGQVEVEVERASSFQILLESVGLALQGSR